MRLWDIFCSRIIVIVGGKNRSKANGICHVNLVHSKKRNDIVWNPLLFINCFLIFMIRQSITIDKIFRSTFTFDSNEAFNIVELQPGKVVMSHDYCHLFAVVDSDFLSADD